MMITEEYANQTIPKPKRGARKISDGTPLYKIAKVCKKAIRDDYKEMQAFAKAFTPDRKGLKDLFDFCDRYFRYLADPSVNGKIMQAIQSPSTLWYETKTGDCKSFTNFIGCTVLNMGLPIELLLVDYGDPIEKHIYPVALLNNKRVPLDVVYRKLQGGLFGTEKPKFKILKKIVVRPKPVTNIVKEPGLYKVGAMKKKQPTHDEVWQGIQDLKLVLSNVPDGIIQSGPGDVTKMTSGELDRYLMKENLQVSERLEADSKLKSAYNAAINAIERRDAAALGTVATTEFGKRMQKFIHKTASDTKPAFQNFNISIPKPINNNEVITVNGIGKIKIGKFFKKVGDTIGGLFKKLANWIFKGPARKMGPFFLYAFIPAKLVGKLTSSMRKKREAQMKNMAWIAQKGKFSQDKIRSLAIIGMKEATGQSPEQLINGYMNSKVGALPAIAAFAGTVIQALGMAVEVIKKIVGLFKKKENDVPEPDKSNAPDASELADWGASLEDKSGDDPGSEESSSALPIAAAAAAAFFAFS